MSERVSAQARKAYPNPPAACEGCGKSGVVLHRHHEDHSKPLEIKWLCRDECHPAADKARRKRLGLKHWTQKKRRRAGAPRNFRIPDPEYALWSAARASAEAKAGQPVSLTEWLRSAATLVARAELNGVDLAGPSGGGLFPVMPAPAQEAGP